MVDLRLQERMSVEMRGLAQEYVQGGEGSVGAAGPRCTCLVCLDGERLCERFVGWEGRLREVEVRVDGFEGAVDVVLPEVDVVFKGGGVCERIRYGPVFFGDIDGDKVVLLVENAC